MLKHRVIPCLLLRNGGLVKTLKFGNPKYVGDPINAIKIFNDKEVDELMVLDISASKENRGPNYVLLEQFASECYMPLCYGGGITTAEEARKLFELGIEKVCLQTATLKSFKIIEEIAKQCGSQSVLISVDIKKNWLGNYELYSSSKGQFVKREWKQFIIDAVSAGVGEIVLNSVDRDGTMKGMDLNLIKQGSSLVNVPLIAMGGVSSLSDIKQGIEAGASAISAGAFFVFHGPHRAVLITYPQYQDLEEFLK